MPSKAPKPKAPPKKAAGRPPKPPLMAPLKQEMDSESEDSGSETQEDYKLTAFRGERSSSTSGLSSQGSQSQDTPTSSGLSSQGSQGEFTIRSSLATPRSSRSNSRAPPVAIVLNDKCTPLPQEKFLYDEAIAKALDDFEPYKPLLESKNYPSVKMWVLQQRGDEMLVKLEDLTVHIKLIYQVYFKLIHATTYGTFLS